MNPSFATKDIDQSIADAATPPVVVADYNVGGHRLDLVAAIARSLGPEAVTVFVPKGTVVSSQFHVHMSTYVSKASLHVLEAQKPCLPVATKTKRRQWVNAAVRGSKGATLVVPAGDWVAISLVFALVRAQLCRRSPEKVLIVLFPYTLSWLNSGFLGRVDRIIRGTVLRLARSTGTVHDCFSIVSPTGSGRPYAPNLGWYGRTGRLALDRVGIAERQPDRKNPSRGDKEDGLCLMIGDLGRRKGLDLVLEAWDSYGFSTLRRCSLLLVGKVAPEDGDLKPKISRLALAGKKLKHIDRYASNQEFDSFIRQSDIVLLVFNGYHAPSGIYLRARALGRPVVIAGNKYLSGLLEVDGAGSSVPAEPGAIAAACATMVPPTHS